MVKRFVIAAVLLLSYLPHAQAAVSCRDQCARFSQAACDKACPPGGAGSACHRRCHATHDDCVKACPIEMAKAKLAGSKQGTRAALPFAAAESEGNQRGYGLCDQ